MLQPVELLVLSLPLAASLLLPFAAVTVFLLLLCIFFLFLLLFLIVNLIFVVYLDFIFDFIIFQINKKEITIALQ